MCKISLNNIPSKFSDHRLIKTVFIWEACKDKVGVAITDFTRRNSMAWRIRRLEKHQMIKRDSNDQINKIQMNKYRVRPCVIRYNNILGLGHITGSLCNAEGSWNAAIVEGVVGKSCRLWWSRLRALKITVFLLFFGFAKSHSLIFNTVYLKQRNMTIYGA